MSGSLILHHLRGHWIPAPDPMDRFADAAVVVLAVLAVAVVAASVVKFYRGRHRADPVLKAAVDRLVEVEKLATGGGPLTDRVAADEKQIAWLRQSYTELVAVIKDVFVEAGQELPWEQQAKPRHLHAVSDDNKAV